MRRLIIAFAWIAPLLLVALWTRGLPLAGLAILALSHALLLIPTLLPNVQWLGPVMTRFASDANEVWLTIDDGPTDDLCGDAGQRLGDLFATLIDPLATRPFGTHRQDARAEAHL